MKLTGKLFITYLLIAAVSLIVLAASTAFVAPEAFSRRIMAYRQPATILRPRTTMWMQVQTQEHILYEDFRESINDALLLAGIAAILTAVVISLTFSRRIVNPIKALVQVSQRIADGHYDERLQIDSQDELGELTMHFNLMAQALADTETKRRQLIADVSHELKTPLASIKGYMEGLQDGVFPATPETFQLIHQEADRLQRLVQDLQELSRTEAGEVEINLQVCDTIELLQTALDRLKPQFADKGVNLEMSVPDHLPQVRADYDRTSQILTNLLGNSLQYTPPGGHVIVDANHHGDFLQFSIKDDGAGLSGEDVHQVFQRFYRADKSRSRRSGGSGIGLTIARHLIEAQGGKIWAESPGLGQGSAFSFTLPIA